MHTHTAHYANSCVEEKTTTAHTHTIPFMLIFRGIPTIYSFIACLSITNVLFCFFSSLNIIYSVFLTLCVLFYFILIYIFSFLFVFFSASIWSITLGFAFFLIYSLKIVGYTLSVTHVHTITKKHM